MRKLLAFIVAALLAVGVLAGCQYRDPNADKGQGNQEMLGNIVLNPDKEFAGKLKIAAPDVASHKRALNAFITSFKEKFPNIVIEPTYFTLNDYKASIGRAAAAAENKDPNKMYDVFWLDQDYVNQWVDLDILSPIDTLMDADESIDEADLNAQMLKMGSAQNHLYMMPRDYNQVVMYYNKDLFKAAKVDYPKDGMTGAEFKAMCEKLATNISKLDDRQNSYGKNYADCVTCVVDCNVAWSSLDYPLVKSFGGSVVNSDGEVVFDSEQTAAAIRYWGDLVNSDGSIPLAINIAEGASKSGVNFRMQQAPIFLHARAVMSDILTDETMAGSDTGYIGLPNLGVAALPNFGGEYAVGAGCSGYAMYKDCANGTAAWQFLKHVVSIEGQNAYSETGDCVPVRTSLLNDPNAAWRTCLPEKLGADFNHDAFIYNMDKACCVNDFYEYVPFAAQPYVTARIEEAFKSCIQDSSNNFASNLSTAAGKMKTDIAVAKG